ncbi:MAG: hypothetical protein Phog2KO_10040 [Phototrophicaceae bacterium]
MKKKKRKRDEIDYHDPNQRLHPPANANVAGANYLSPSKPINFSCHVCGDNAFEWGYFADGDIHYKTKPIQKGRKVKVRCCLGCNNLQLFSE